MTTTADDTAMRFLIALFGGPMIGWALGYFIRKSIKVIASKYVTEVTEENILYCKELSKFAEVHHLNKYVDTSHTVAMMI